MQSSLVSRNVTLPHGRTSMRLEPAFWNALTIISERERMSVAEWIESVSADGDGGRTSAVRVGVLRYVSRAEAPNRVRGPFQWIAELTGSTAASDPSVETASATIG